MVRRLLLLNGIAVLGVALNHASGYGFRAMFEWAEVYLPAGVSAASQTGSLAFYANVFIQQLIYFTLPAFLFVSGFFIAFTAGGSKSPVKWPMVFSRVKTLVIPLIVWIAIIFAFFLRRLPTSLDDALRSYYYIPLLIQNYLLSPFIVRIAKTKGWWVLLVGAAVAELARDSLRYLDTLGVNFPGLEILLKLTPPWLLPTLLFWFVLGVVAGLHREGFVRWIGRVKWGLLVATPIFLLLSMVEYWLVAQAADRGYLGPYFGGYARSLYALAFLLCFLAFDRVKILFTNQLQQLGSKSLGIYLAHGPVMYLVAVAMYELTPWTLGMQLIYQGILITCGLGISLLMMYVVGKTPLRVAYHYLFG